MDQNSAPTAVGQTRGGIPKSDRGRDQIGVRAYNERLVLSLLRREGALARAELARRTGLSAQTVSVIIRALAKDGLIVEGAPVKGKVGQPLKPISLAPNCVSALGLKIGRRSCEMVLMNIVGDVIDHVAENYAYPRPAPLLTFAAEAIETLTRPLSEKAQTQISGLGVATPYFLADWSDNVGAKQGEMEEWRDLDLLTALQAISRYPVTVQNDMSAACGAELLLGHGRTRPDFFYVFIGAFIGGGLALGGTLYHGANGNAGAIGPTPVTLPNGKTGQLIDVASQFLLEDAVRAKGLDPLTALLPDREWTGFEQALTQWIDVTAHHLARAAVSWTALLDVPLVVIDGGFPTNVKDRLVQKTRAALAANDLRGIYAPEITAGLVGHRARSIGAASLPLLERFLLDAGATPVAREE